MEFINNTTKTLKDDLSVQIKQGSKISVAAACFSIYAFQELKEQLTNIDKLRFIFTSPAFVIEKTKKAIAKECVEWIKKKVAFKSNVSDKTIQGQLVVDNVGYTPINNFTTDELGCENGNVISTTIVKDTSLAQTFLSDFNEIWYDSKMLQEVTDEVIDSITAA